MKILSIETSCDETAVSYVEARGALGAKTAPKFQILGNVVLSQIPLHRKYGGVYPSLAKREHAKNILGVFIECLNQGKALEKKKSTKAFSKNTQEKLEKLLEREPELARQILETLSTFKKPKIDAVAVTYGPGLEPALWVGINFAKALALIWDIPIIPVNHMEGHATSALLEEQKDKNNFQALKNIEYPAILLLVSGGHTELIEIKKPLGYKFLGGTRDDAAGEAFDKTARLLGLPYPGGPEIAALAKKCTNTPRFSFPRPLQHSDDFDFSFSGLKTSVLYTTKEIKRKTEKIKTEVAKEIEDAIADVLFSKTKKALEKKKAHTLILGGGVTANAHIRKTFEDFAKANDITLLIPSQELTTDNALMIALAGYLRAQDSDKNLKTTERQIKNIKANGNLNLAN